MAQPRKHQTSADRQKAYRERKNRVKRNAEALQMRDKEQINLSNPPVRYYGGKWRIAPWIIERFPPHTTYCEPFCGAANILFRKPSSKFEVINDLNGDVVNFFDMLRARSDDLIRAIDLTPYSRLEHKRAHEPSEQLDPIERARRFYVRSRQSYGTGEGEYNTGWRFQSNENRGKSVIEEWSQLNHLMEAARRLKQVQIECKPALQVIKRFDTPDTLFYVDPPYLFETRYSDEIRYTHEMTVDDHKQLAALLQQVRGMVILSGYLSDLYQSLYSGWRVISKETKTNGNHKAIEYLWISPAAQSLHALPLFRHENP